MSGGGRQFCYIPQPDDGIVIQDNLLSSINKLVDCGYSFFVTYAKRLLKFWHTVPYSIFSLWLQCSNLAPKSIISGLKALF